MAATPSDVQAKLDKADSYLAKTTSSYSQMVQKHGADWTTWPKTSNWYLALSTIAAARTEVASLTTKILTAAFKDA